MESEQAALQSPTRGLTFDDFLKEDKTAERGTFVYNTGASPWGTGSARSCPTPWHRGCAWSQRLHDCEPFADEYGIELDEHPGMHAEPHALSPGHDEVMSDIYDATPLDGRSSASHTSPRSPSLLSPRFSSISTRAGAASPPPWTLPLLMNSNSRHLRLPLMVHPLERELADVEYTTAGHDERDAYASIQAWAQGSNPGFYSPLPESPVAPLSEPELISEGQATPTYSASLAGSGVDVANDAVSSRGGDFDVLSEDDDGIPTPNSWSEVGSVISESDGMHY